MCTCLFCACLYIVFEGNATFLNFKNKNKSPKILKENLVKIHVTKKYVTKNELSCVLIITALQSPIAYQKELTLTKEL